MSTHTTIQKEDVERLANLARLALTDQEIAFFQKDIEAILSFVDVVQDVPHQTETPTSEGFAPVGGMRSDEHRTVPSSSSPEDLIHAAPNHTDQAVKVKKILG